MRFRITIMLCVMLITAQMPAQSQKENKTVSEKKETKLTMDQRLKLMTKELDLTANEQEEVSKVLTGTQLGKEKIKALNLSKKDEKARIEKIKDLQKAKLKKILGAKRFAKYQKLKKEDVL